MNFFFIDSPPTVVYVLNPDGFLLDEKKPELVTSFYLNTLKSIRV